MKIALVLAWLVGLSLAGCAPDQTKQVPDGPHVVWDDPVQAGRYLVLISQCNDCHTDGYLMAEGKVPEENWLTGSPMGWQGPWGTTYPSNLRLRVQEWTEEQWVTTLKTRKALPPMPWANVSHMDERDMRAIYVYIRSLGPKGAHMPLAVVAGQQPSTPYLSLYPQNMPTAQIQN